MLVLTPPRAHTSGADFVVEVPELVAVLEEAEPELEEVSEPTVGPEVGIDERGAEVKKLVVMFQIIGNVRDNLNDSIISGYVSFIIIISL